LPRRGGERRGDGHALILPSSWKEKKRGRRSSLFRLREKGEKEESAHPRGGKKKKKRTIFLLCIFKRKRGKKGKKRKGRIHHWSLASILKEERGGYSSK